MAITTTTALQAVNTMLQTIGESAVTDLDDPAYEVSAAVTVLDEITKDVLARGWNFNTEYDVPLTPITAGVGAQGMISVEDDVDTGDIIYVTDAAGLKVKFTCTDANSITTGDVEVTDSKIWVSIMDGTAGGTRNKLTTSALMAREIAEAITSVTNLKVTAVQVKAEGAASTADSVIELDEYPTTHPDYVADSSSVTNFDSNLTHKKSILLTQTIIGSAGNGSLADAELVGLTGASGTPSDQITTYPFGKNGMRVGRDVGENLIILGSDVARLEIESSNKGSIDPIMKYDNDEWKLYDKKARSFAFGGTVKATIVYFYPFIALPEEAKHYIVARSARVFADRMVGSRDIRAFTEQDENQAWVALLDSEEVRNGRNMLSGSSSVGNMLNRRA